MAHPKHDATSLDVPSFPQTSNGYRPGGQVGEMQADLAHRLAQENMAWGPTSVLHEQPSDPAVRLMSTASGYLTLLLAYAGVMLTMFLLR